MMIKDIPDETMMKLISHILRNNHLKKYKVKTKNGIKIVTPDDIIAFSAKMAKSLENKDYGEIKKCATCGCFSAPDRDGRGCCFPKDFTSSKHSTDYCSKWIPMTEDQKAVRKKLYTLRAKAERGKK